MMYLVVGFCGISVPSGDRRYQATEAGEEGLLPPAHELTVERLLAEATLGGGARPRLQTHLLPRLHQPVCGGQQPSVEPTEMREVLYRTDIPTKTAIIWGVWCGVGAMRSSSSPLATVG